MPKILVLGEQTQFRTIISESLWLEGHLVESVADAAMLWDYLGNTQPDLVLLDANFDGFGTMQLFQDLKQQFPGLGGMCFKSYLSLQPGATISIRFKKIHPNGSSSGYCEGLHLVTLADVKWCHEATGSEVFPYGVGVKYSEPVY